MTNRNRSQGRSFTRRSQPAPPNATETESESESASPPPNQWRRRAVNKAQNDGRVSTTIRFPKERYDWLHQVSSATGRNKSDLVDQALELLAEKMGYGMRPLQ